MAWPKRGTRQIVVNDIAYLWHYDACCPWCSDDVITVGNSGAPYVLFIDPFPHSAEISPKYVAETIKWAVARGWTTDKGPTRAVSINSENDNYFWLKEGERHAKCVGPAPENV